MNLSKKVIIITVAVLLVLIGGGVVYATNTPTAKAERQLNLGNKYLQEGKYQEAILAFQKVIEIEPKNIAARLGLGKVYVATKDFTKAETVLKEVIGIDEKNITARVDLFRVYLKEGNLDAANAILQEIIQIDPNKDVKQLKVDLELAKEYSIQNVNNNPSPTSYLNNDAEQFQKDLETTKANSTSKIVSSSLPFSSKDLIVGDITMNISILEVTNKLGEPNSISSNSYNDKILKYPFGDFIFLKPDGDSNFTLRNIIIRSSSITGPRGIVVGESYDSVISKFPLKDLKMNEYYLKKTNEGLWLTFINSNHSRLCLELQLEKCSWSLIIIFNSDHVTRLELNAPDPRIK